LPFGKIVLFITRGGEALKKYKTDELDENYKNLYAAIYKQAVADDCREVRKKTKEALISRGVDSRRIHKYLEEMESEIKDLVCEAVYKEAQSFGETAATRKMRNRAIIDISNQIVDVFCKG
jgi:hypothetical protein